MKRISFGYYCNNQEQGVIQDSVKKCLEVIQSTTLLSPSYVTLMGKNKRHPIQGINDSLLKKKNYINVYIYSENEEYEILASVIDNELCLMVFFSFTYLTQTLPHQEMVKLYKKLTNIVPQPTSTVGHGPDNEIFYELYEPFDFTGRNSDFTGFSWLNYLGPEEMALNGGEDLYHLPYITKAEPLGEGIFIQVGDTPNDATTEAGKQQLFKATEAWWQMMQAKQD